MGRQHVRAAIESEIVSFANTNSLEVWGENVPARPSSDYVQIQLFPGKTQDPSIGANHKRYVGILRATLALKDLTNGPSKIEALSGAFCDIFYRGSVFVKDDATVVIDSTPSESSVGFDTVFVYVSVDVVYRCDVITN